jgi:pyridoxal biosynthesis lyase PdxS
VSTLADAAMMMQLGAGGVVVGSGDPRRPVAVVENNFSARAELEVRDRAPLGT